MLDTLRYSNFPVPSNIQSYALPYAIGNQDIICQGKSGMGKTTMFIISIINELQEQIQTDDGV